MRVLITSDIFPPDVGGPATYVPRIAEALQQRGHQVTALTYSAVSAYSADRDLVFCVVRIALDPPQWRRILRTLSAILKYGHDADVIYANGLVTESVLANYWLRKPMLAKVVGDLAWERARDKGWIQDDIDLFQTRRYARRVECLRWRRNWTYQHMNRVIVPSGYLREMLVRHWGLVANRVQVIYNSFEEAGPSRPPAPSARGGAAVLDLPTRHKIVTVCRLTSWKGVDGLIQVLPELPEAGLVVLGDGPLRGQLESQARELGVAERVRFVGTVPREQVAGYLRACDVFVLNSTYEGLPHVLLEAMAAGLPVIATRVGGSTEIVESGRNGLLVPPRDTAALRQALSLLLSDPAERAALVRNSQSTLTQFSFQTMVAQTESAILSVSQGNRERPPA